MLIATVLVSVLALVRRFRRQPTATPSPSARPSGRRGLQIATVAVVVLLAAPVLVVAGGMELPCSSAQVPDTHVSGS